MTQRDSSRRCEVWSRYWASGSPHSCGTSYDSIYGGSIGAFWRDAFALLVAGERVLDIATGNAALPRLLVASRPGLAVECDAVDLAQVAPGWIDELDPAQRERLRIHSGFSAESMPFADGAFDLVVSQYGIEYADFPRAIGELLRVLSPRGRVRILAHHAQSRTVMLASDEIGHIEWLLHPDGLLGLAAEMIEPIVRAATAEGRERLATDAASNRLRRLFNEKQRALSERLSIAACPDVLREVRDWVAQIFALALTAGRAPALEALAKVPRLLADSLLRLEELRSHALDDADVRRLCEALRDGGVKATTKPLHDGAHLLGWAVLGDRQA